MDFNRFFAAKIDALKQEGRYRTFFDMARQAGRFPLAHHDGQDMMMWCSNDYLGMGQNPAVLKAMHAALDEGGAGAGGTRNIGGTSPHHRDLEKTLADLHQKEASLLFGSGWIANLTTFSVLARAMPDALFFSDSHNHNSMIEGLRLGHAEKIIFPHNDVESLENMLRTAPPSRPKIIAFESVYSMGGDFGRLADLCDVAERYGALTYLDEVHGVGLYGPGGAGVAARDGVMHRIDIIQGTLAKAFGVVGGYIAGKTSLVDYVRSSGTGFIFSTALPPHIAAGARASIEKTRTADSLREDLLKKADYLRQTLKEAGLPVMPGTSHIVPVMVGDAHLCKQITDQLRDHFSIYVQPINYPTVPKGTERIRLTPTPCHRHEDIDNLCMALVACYSAFGLLENNIRKDKAA
jgi:5-aminolevulinate synthase